MNIVVLGANGGTGRQVVQQALKMGHKVTAVLRNPDKLALSHPQLRVVKGDVMDPIGLSGVLANQEVVISAIGKSSFKPTTLYSQGNKNILHAMDMAGVRRVFFISASGLEVNPTHSLPVRLATRYILQRLLKNMYADLESMEQMVKTSSLDWTILRPPRLTDKLVTGRYRFSINSQLKNGLSISRPDLAHYMLHHLNDTGIYKATVEVAY